MQAGGDTGTAGGGGPVRGRGGKTVVITPRPVLNAGDGLVLPRDETVVRLRGLGLLPTQADDARFRGRAGNRAWLYSM